MGQAGSDNEDPAGCGRANGGGFHRLDGVGATVSDTVLEDTLRGSR